VVHQTKEADVGVRIIKGRALGGEGAWVRPDVVCSVADEARRPPPRASFSTGKGQGRSISVGSGPRAHRSHGPISVFQTTDGIYGSDRGQLVPGCPWPLCFRVSEPALNLVFGTHRIGGLQWRIASFKTPEPSACYSFRHKPLHATAFLSLSLGLGSRGASQGMFSCQSHASFSDCVPRRS
jgi:hypothetical protein